MRRAARWALIATGLSLVAALIIAIVALVAGAMALRSASGSAQLLSWVPGLTVVEPKGAVWGDFSARRIELALPHGSSLTLMAPQWRGLRWERSGDAAWGLQLHLDRLQADSADLLWVSSPGQQPSQGPPALDLPIGVRVDALSVRRFQSNLTGAQAFMGIEGSLALQQPAPGPGARHLISLDQLSWQKWRLQGRLALATGGAMPVEGQLTASSDGEPRGRGQVVFKGPLSRLVAQAKVDVQAQDGRDAVAAQTLAADLVLAPWSPWPLPAASVTAKDFDLQQVWARWPATSVTGDLRLAPREVQPGSPGTRVQGVGKAPSPASDLLIHAQLRNERPGPWDAGRVPLVSVQAQAVLPSQARGGSWQALGRLGRVDAVVALPSRAGRRDGEVRLEGRWDLAHRRETALRLGLRSVDTQALHSLSPALALQGEVRVQGQSDESWLITGQLDGKDGGDRVLKDAVQATLAGRWSPGSVTLDSLKLAAGAARAQASGQWTAAVVPPELAQAQGNTPSPWTAKAEVKVEAFDPAVWLPWPRAPGDAIQRTRLTGDATVDMAVPGPLAQAQGEARLMLQDSLLLGVPISGKVQAQVRPAEGGGGVKATVALRADGNDLQAEASWPGTLASLLAREVPVGAQVEGRLDAPSLGALQAWARPLGWQGLTGRLTAQGLLRHSSIDQWESRGRWSADGVAAQAVPSQLTTPAGPAPQGGQVALTGAQGRWDVGGGGRASAMPWQLEARIERAQWGQWALQQLNASLQGTAGAHQLSLQTRVDLPERKLSSGAVVRESVWARAAGRAGWSASAAEGGSRGWHARLETLRVQPVAPADAAPWLDVQPFELSWADTRDGQSWRATPTRVNLFGAALSLRRLLWEQQGAQPGRTDVMVDLEPLKLAEVLARWQPKAGWGGDLTLTGRLQASHQPAQPWVVDAQLARQGGDLSLVEAGIDGSSAQRLGVRDLRLALQARQGVWTATQQVDARVIGTLTGQQVVQGRDRTALPGPEDLLAGRVDAKVANLRSLGVWAPAGWRLSGQLTGQAVIGGTLGAPTYEGQVQGQQIGASHTLMGVNLTDGVLDMRLKGQQLRLERFTARGGEQGGTVSLTGDALLGEQPTADLRLTAQRFALLQRVDRRAVVSGELQLGLGEETLSAQGRVRVDQGLIDISQGDAPTIGDDVNVINRPGEEPLPEGGPVTPTPRRKLQVTLAVDLGPDLRLRGRGVDTRLQGSATLTTPNGRPQVVGTVSTVDGTYAAYGQRLIIERGTLAFTGPIDNPRLDIQAMRPQSPTASASDVKVGVLISGTAQDPRVRLYSEPAMSETEKLSWLVLGRGPAGLGGADIGLLQTAAAALMGGEGGSPKDSVIAAIGLDELSVRQTDGAVRDTIVTVGKQLSNRWYVGYERSLNATEGTWQLIYRLAQRFTLRAQSGEDNAIDLIWSLRWD